VSLALARLPGRGVGRFSPPSAWLSPSIVVGFALDAAVQAVFLAL
jgi:hypothetical protein